MLSDGEDHVSVEGGGGDPSTDGVTRRYLRRTRLPVSAQEAFAWHERPGAFQRLTPPFMPTRPERVSATLTEGTEVVFRLLPWAGPLAPRWHARHVHYDPPAEFRDVQVSGPFRSWRHRHRFEPDGASSCVLTDDVAYALPFGPAGAAAGGPVDRMLDRMFAYRHRVTVADLAAHAEARRRGTRPMHVAVTGSSGLIGSALIPFLTTGGHQVTRLVRRSPGDGELGWDPDAGSIDEEGLRGVDAVVHLAGEPIGAVRWSADKKRRILDSRVNSTRLIAETLARLDDGPRVLVTASGINYYGDRGDERLTEDSPSGEGFMAEVCRQWEAATAPAEAAGVRVVRVRTGIVQSPQGGALAKLLPMFKTGVGARLGSGDQWTSWISLDDVVGIYHHALTTGSVSGPVNATAPEPVTNRDYTDVLGRVLGRPTVLTVPRFGPRLVLGELADELLFASMRVLPERARAAGYEFRHPTLEGCLRDILGRPAQDRSA
jgi:uncharacterized protein